jgi:uncharacterized protein
MPAEMPARAPAESGDQRQTIALLRRPETYGVPDVQCLETHANLVFLAGADAYKIKRAVRFEYMDFSTLEKRRAACVREVKINRLWAPDLYFGCVPITREPEGMLSLGGDGEIVEWAVHMRRFDENDLLSKYADSNRLDRQLAIQLADAVFASHGKVERAARPSGTASYRELAASICGGLTAVDAGEVSRLATALEQQLDGTSAIIDERAAHGFVRRCHGDLHLANIVLHHGRPTLYDALEFDEALATIDTLYDLAFLLMDLDVRGHRPAANIVLNRYLYRSREKLDLRGLAILPLFLSLRAAVRALVTSDRAAQEAGQDREGDLVRARRYLASALEYAAPVAPRLVVVAGLSGSGKTTLAAALAPWLSPAPGAVHLRSDLERKALAGVGEFERLPDSTYTPQARQRVYRSLHEKAATILRAHHSVILDAVYDSETERTDLEDLAGALGIPMHGLWLHTADAATLIARVEGRRDDASDATPDVVRHQLSADIGRLSTRWHELDADRDYRDTLHSAMSAVGLGPS